jgi:cell division protein FtsW (lipid II flippase)
MGNIKEHFLSEVLQHIKSKEAKEVVYKELSYHIRMSKVDLVSKGTNEKEAEEKAIKQMGSPNELGIHFNKLYRPMFDWQLFSLFLFIIIMGILPTLNDYAQERYAGNLMLNQMIYIILGIFVSIIVMLIDYRKIKKMGWFFLIAGIGLLLTLNLFPNVEINGVGYIHLFGITITGSSLFPLLLVFWAFYFSKEKPKLIVVLAVYLLSVFLYIGLPSFPSVIIYSVLVFILFLFSSISKKVIYGTIGVSFTLILILVSFLWFTAKEYQKVRLLAFFNPDEYAQNAGYMYIVLKNLLSDGGWIGNQDPPSYVGILTPDMAFANITYFYGWMLAGFLFVLLSLLLFRLLILFAQIKDQFGKQLILGVCSLLSVQFVYNVGMILGLLPIISMSLPFISYGLTPTVLNSLLIGIVLSVYRRKNLVLN